MERLEIISQKMFLKSLGFFFFFGRLQLMYSKIKYSLVAMFVPCFKNSSLFLVSLLMDLILYQHLTLRFFSLVLISSYLHLSLFQFLRVPNVIFPF